MALPVVLNVVAWAALAGGVGLVAAKNADLGRRLDQAESALAASAARETDLVRERREARTALAAAPRPDEAPALEAVRKDVRELWAAVLKAPEGGGAGGEGAAGTAGTAGSAGSAVPGPALEAAVKDVVDRYVMERKFRDQVAKAAGPAIPKKPKFAALAKHLDLEPDQASRLEQDVRDIQMRLYETLTIPRADGVVLMDEIAMAEQYPEGSPQKTAPFLKLFKLKIPDTEETYVERAIALVMELKQHAPEYLAVEQMETLNALDLDWFGIKFD